MNEEKEDNEKVMSLSIFEQLFQNYAHKCNCNEAIEFRTKIVHRLKTSSIKLTSVFVGEKLELCFTNYAMPQETFSNLNIYKIKG